MKRANSELAAVAWLLSLPETPAGKVATELPASDLWAPTGFIQVVGVVGGTQLTDAPLRRPIVQVDFWACATASSIRPPWAQAAQLGEAVVACCQSDSPHRSKVVTPRPGKGFEPVEIRDVSVLTELRRFRVPDTAGFARYTMDLNIQWTTL